MPEKSLVQDAKPVASRDNHPRPAGGEFVRENPGDTGHGSKPASRLAAGTAFKMGRAQTESGVVWITAVFMVIFHAGAIAALFFFSWTNLIVAAVLYVLAINCGIGMGYHRLLVHRGYQVPKLVEYFLTLCGTLALEGGPIAWVATHRVHHQHSDREGDPRTQHRDCRPGTLRSGSRQGSLPGIRQQIPLGSADVFGDFPSGCGNRDGRHQDWSWSFPLGHFSSCDT